MDILSEKNIFQYRTGEMDSLCRGFDVSQRFPPRRMYRQSALQMKMNFCTFNSAMKLNFSILISGTKY